MKKLLAFGLCLVMCFAFSACNESKTSSETLSETSSEISNETYTYKVRAMQGVEVCAYYGPDAYVPNSPNPEAARNKIHVWTQCMTCGESFGLGHYTIPVGELDFSSGDTIQYTGSDQCWDCNRDKGIESFMWVVEITRIAEE